MLLIVVLIIYAAFQAPALARERRWRQLGVFAVIVMAGIILNGLLILGVRVPNPGDALNRLFGVK